MVAAQRAAGYVFDRQNAVLKSTLAGVNRVKARTEVVRKATPLLGSDLHRILQGLNPEKPRDARDGALLSLGWAGALRRNEIVSLDWQQIGEGKGFVRIDERGIVITLMRSKASQDAAVEVILPVDDMPSASIWLNAWAKLANLQPGEPVFRGIIGKRISEQRLGDHSVNDATKSRVRAYAKSKGRSKKEAKELEGRFSGHSLRSGFATSAADIDVPLHRLAEHTRQRSLETLQGYIRTSQKWKRSPLKGLGF